MKHKHHIIPRHMGGTDDPDNLIELTVEEHANAHKKLYEDHGRWQDYVAWQGLAQLSTEQDLVALRLRESGKAGAAKSNLRWKDPAEKLKHSKRLKQIYANREKTWKGKLYEITHPDGTVEIVEGLHQWCLDKGYNPNTFGNACLRGSITNGGFKVKQI